MDFINLCTNDAGTISSIINSSYLTITHNTTRETFFKLGKKGVRVTAKKEFDDYGFIRYKLVKLSLKPHYYYNCDLHNGNEFSTLETVEVLNEIMSKLNVTDTSLIKPTSFDYGVNVIPDQFDTKDIVINSLYYGKKPLLTPRVHLPYSKTTKAPDSHPTIGVKTYHKGLQFPDLVHRNTWRYENMFASFRKLNKAFGIQSFSDFLTHELYEKVSHYLLKSWDSVLILDKISPENYLYDPEYYKDQWHLRNGLNNAKNQYYNTEGFMHRELKALLEYSLTKQLGKMQIPTIIDSLNLHMSDQKRDVTKNEQREEVRRCIVTGVDISSQKKESRYLCLGGLKSLLLLQPKKYAELERNYLSDKMKTRPVNDQIYYIAHNIRNSATNQVHNRRRFEERNYHPSQMQFNF